MYTQIKNFWSNSLLLRKNWRRKNSYSDLGDIQVQVGEDRFRRTMDNNRTYIEEIAVSYRARA